MKLQGKKTGAFADFIGFISPSNPTVIDLPSGEPMLTVRYQDAGAICYKDYKTVAEFNEDWEDYKPVEPLEDPKIRKAVRAWAEASEIDTHEIKANIGAGNVKFVGWRKGDPFGIEIGFRGQSGTGSIVDGGVYTITELCGEEQE